MPRKPRYPLSPLAELLLQTHQMKPDDAFYNIRVFGGMFSNKALENLRNAYRELEDAGLVERSGRYVRFFDDVVSLYRLAEAGKSHADASSKKTRKSA